MAHIMWGQHMCRESGKYQIAKVQRVPPIFLSGFTQLLNLPKGERLPSRVSTPLAYCTGFMLSFETKSHSPSFTAVLFIFSYGSLLSSGKRGPLLMTRKREKRRRNHPIPQTHFCHSGICKCGLEVFRQTLW